VHVHTRARCGAGAARVVSRLLLSDCRFRRCLAFPIVRSVAVRRVVSRCAVRHVRGSIHRRMDEFVGAVLRNIVGALPRLIGSITAVGHSSNISLSLVLHVSESCRLLAVVRRFVGVNAVGHVQDAILLLLSESSLVLFPSCRFPLSPPTLKGQHRCSIDWSLLFEFVVVPVIGRVAVGWCFHLNYRSFVEFIIAGSALLRRRYWT